MCKVSGLCMCDCSFPIVVSSGLYRLPWCLEPICCRGHVGCFRRCHTGSSWSICHCCRLRQVFDHLQPYGLPAVQAQLSRVSLQGHIYVTTEDLQRKSAFRAERTLQTPVTAQQGQQHVHTHLKRTAGQLRGVSALHWECRDLSCDHPPKDCLHPDWICLQRGDSQPALSQISGWFTLGVPSLSFMKQTRQDRCSPRQER